MFEDEKAFYLKSIHILGETKKKFHTTQTLQFLALKFSTTTFTNNGKKFHLVIVVYKQEENQKKQVILSKISPQIFVDSRIKASQQSEFKEKKFDYFEPDRVTQALIKKENLGN